MSVVAALVLVWVGGMLAVAFIDGLFEPDSWEDNVVGLALFWPVIAAVLVAAAPFIIVNKAGQRLRRHWAQRRELGE